MSPATGLSQQVSYRLEEDKIAIVGNEAIMVVPNQDC